VQSPFSRLDHLVYATPDLAAAVRDLGVQLGVVAAPGGRHPGWGTRNALLALGPRVYLEIVGPDPEGSPPPGQRPFSIDGLSSPRLVTWAFRGEDLPAVVRNAARGGVDLGEVQARSRQRPDGSTLSWTMTDPLADRAGGIVPFFINWGDSPHPAGGAPAECRLLSVRAEHPDARRVSSVLGLLGIDLTVETGAAPALAARLATPRGEVELR
jgi:hypothetical protein